MSGKIFNTRVKNKRDSVSNWTDKNPILLDGEVVVVDSTDGESRFKIGDGTKHYSELPFQDEYLQNEINNKAAIEAGVYTAVASSSDGVAYTSTVPGISELSTGASFIMIPDKTSASKEPTLDVNGLGEKKIRRRLSAITTSLQSGYSNTWISINKPFQIVYDGAAWVVEGMPKPVGADVYGAVPQATADASGNVITDTYATIAMLQSMLPKVTTITLASGWNGTASVNASVITYGDNAVFTFTPESDDYKLYGWYADEGLTQLVSEDNPYTCTPTTDYKLYPKSGAIMYTIKLTRGLKGVAGRSGTWTLKIAALYYDQLTYHEKQYVKTGEFDKIESSKVFGQATKTGTDTIAAVKASLQVPANTTCAIWCQLSDAPVTCFAESGDISLGERSMLTYWPYYIFTPTQDKEYFCYYSDSACICTAIAKGGIEYADATTPTFAGKDAMFTAIVKEGYTFKGWYSDEGCTTFISSNNPLSITTPSVNKDSADSQDGEATTSELTLYARARSTTGRSDMLYFKVNGSYKSATKVYKKVSGTWVEQADLPAIFSGEPSGGASNYVYGGSV